MEMLEMLTETILQLPSWDQIGPRIDRRCKVQWNSLKIHQIVSLTVEKEHNNST